MDADPNRQGCAGTVVVFYRPDANCVARANRLAQFGPCVVVDNTEAFQDAAALGLDPAIEYLPNGTNLGVATALNQGIAALSRGGCSSAILFDQDSDPSDELLTALPQALERELKRDPRVALIGPAYEDARLGGTAPFVRFGYLFLKRVPPVGTKLIEVDFLITSGSCMNLAAWSVIGKMDDALFIDFVDVEWCVRARLNGYAVLGAPSLRLAHSLGGEPVRVFGRPYPGHGALRHYYQFRNVIALVKRRYMPLSWKSTELLKLPVRLAVYCIFMAPRIDHLKMSLRGIWDGMTGRLGAWHRE